MIFGVDENKSVIRVLHSCFRFVREPNSALLYKAPGDVRLVRSQI